MSERGRVSRPGAEGSGGPDDLSLVASRPSHFHPAELSDSGPALTGSLANQLELCSADGRRLPAMHDAVLRTTLNLAGYQA